LRPWPGCGKVIPVPTRIYRILMRPSPSILRTLLRASRVVVPCLLCLAVASVARADDLQMFRAARRRPGVCDPRTVPIRKMMAAKASLGPVANRSKRIQGGLTDTAARLKRASHAKLGEDPEAIQTDAPAAHFEFDEGAKSPLRPVGVLSSSFDRLPPATPFFPRSPRGPPSAA
jgi:hypothetical protein